MEIVIKKNNNIKNINNVISKCDSAFDNPVHLRGGTRTFYIK